MLSHYPASIQLQFNSIQNLKIAFFWFCRVCNCNLIQFLVKLKNKFRFAWFSSYKIHFNCNVHVIFRIFIRRTNPKRAIICNESCIKNLLFKVHIFWEGHKFFQNLHLRFVLCSASQIYGGDFAKVCGLLRIYEL